MTETEFGIGRIPDDVDQAAEAVAELDAQTIEAARGVGHVDFAPAGTTSGRRVSAGTHCENCGRPADGYNPGAGQNLCSSCWDEY